MRFRGWTRLWILATVLWAIPVGMLVYPYWEQNLTLGGLQPHHVRWLFDDLGLAIDRAEGGRLEASVIDNAANTLLGSKGRTIAGFEELAKHPPKFAHRMKRIPFMGRYYVFPVDATDEEVAAALATESSRRAITEWARNEPLRLDLLMRDAADFPPGAQFVELRTAELLAAYYRAVEQLPMERVQALLAGLALWLVPSLIVYAMGWSIGWVVRGFRTVD